MAILIVNLQHQVDLHKNWRDMSVISAGSPTRPSENSTQKSPVHGGEEVVQTLDPSSIRSLLEASFAMQQMDHLLDVRCSVLHEDDKLDCFTKVFQEIININGSLFSFKTPLEKAEILFNFHTREVVSPIVRSEEFNALISSFFQMIGSSYRTQETRRAIILEAVKKLKENVRDFHANYIRLAVAKALKIPFEDIQPLSFSLSEELEINVSPSIEDVYRL